MNFSESLIGKALEGHSRLKESINSIQDQLCYLQDLRSSSKETILQIEQSDLLLEKSANNLSKSCIELPTLHDCMGTRDALHSTLLNKSNNCTETRSKTTKMQLKDLNGSSSEFDLTAILSHLSSSELNTSNVSADSSKDELISLLERISTAGKDLQLELADAKEREASLKSELSDLKQKVHSFNMSSGSGVSNMLHINGSTDVQQVTMQCEKLQDAMLSLQDENMRLNRLLRENGRVSSDGSSSVLSVGSKHEDTLKEELKLTQQKLKQVRDVLEETMTQQQRTEKKYKYEKEERMRLQTLINEMKESTQSIVDDFNSLDARERSMSLLKMENEQQLKRIENLEWQLKLHQKSTCNEQSYMSRIDDLNKLLVHKENELHTLKAHLRKKDEDLLMKKASVEQKKGGDITKRKEVLLLCEKYEMLRKNQKRLEEDLRTSQSKLQEEHTRRWSLETSLQQLTTENEELKENQENITKLKAEALENVSIIRDYERLTQKYESLLSLRLHEYNRIKKIKGHKKKQEKKLESSTPRMSQEQKMNPAWTQAENERRFNRIEKFIMGTKKNDEEELEDDSHTRSKSVDSAVYERQPLRDIPVTRKYLQDRDFPAARELPIVNERTFRKEQIPTPRYKSKFARENLATKVVEQAQPQKLTMFDDNECRRYDNVLTSTPVKEKSHNKLQDQDPLPLKLYVKKSDCVNKQWLPDHITHKEENGGFTTPKRFEFSRRGRSDYKNVSNMARAKSLSPHRNNKDFDDSAILTSRSNNSTLQPKVSFNLPRHHHRSHSAADGDRSQYKSRFLRNLDKSPSPLEVQQIVRNAYEEEYIKNMKGVNSQPKYTPPEIRKKLFDIPTKPTKKEENKSPFSEEYLKIMEEINELKQNHISVVSSSNSDLKTLTPRGSIASDISTPRKGILKRSSSPKLQIDYSASNQQSTLSGNQSDDKRDDFSDLVACEKRDTRIKEKSFDEKDFIIDVVPPCHNSSLSLASSCGEILCENNISGILKNKSKVPHSIEQDEPHRALRVEDLTIPYQLQNAKDSDTESSISTTRDHIGRFEFLQDIQSHTKNHRFSHQKPADLEEEGKKSLEESEKKDMDENMNLIGLSARQQEYADKLVKKYTKSNTSQ